ncbi:malonyl-CoA synthase [Sphingomonas sp.]|jgi:malonyl-CoA/methylmalonyl-CoA synthetase|uniref:malonate--CoA ligase n=1 Tax=Sphingomonas sp. TaxID=28214 RepID=UPI002EDA9C99
MSMENLLFDALLRPHGDNSAPFLFPEKGGPVSFAAFLRLSARYANLFESLGVAKGDRVAVQVAKSPQALALYAACVRSGAALLPLNPAYTTDEVAYFAGDAEPRLLICAPAAQAALAPIASRHGATVLTLDRDGSGSLADAAHAADTHHAPRACGPDDLAAILYTSGTTGRSKGAMLSHANLLSNAQVLADLWRFSSGDVLLHALPIFHTHGLFVAVNVCLQSGAAMIFHEGFIVDAILNALPRATTMMGVPTFYTRLLQSPRLTRQATEHMRLFISGSAPLLAETHDAFASRTGHRILERYGMTETNMNSSNPYEGARRAGTVGFALPGTEIAITDPESGGPVPPGEIGMIEVRGPNVFSGYWKMPEKTAEELRPNGFFITGDLGQFDDRGYLSIVGRQKDLIISGGYNIYPREIELLIDELEGVAESAVFGVPDPDFGEAVIAAVVADGSGVATADMILDQCRLKLARFKHPRQVILLDDLPRNAMGKVQKNLLRERHAPGPSPAGRPNSITVRR